MSAKRFLLLYLNTGAGHVSAAKAVKQAIEKSDPSAQVFLELGYNKKTQWLYHIILEKGYQFSSTVIPPLFSLTILFFRPHWMQTFLKKLISRSISRHIRRLIMKHKITDVVSFHFVLTPSCVMARRTLRLHKKISDVKLSCVVTDPFEPEPAWFYEKSVNYFVFSEKARRFAIEKCKNPSDKVHIMPFILNEKFLNPPAHEEILTLRQKYGFSADKKILLLAGGGEGLPHAAKIVQACLSRKNQFSLIVVCGRDKIMQKSLSAIAKLNPRLDLRVFGFVNFMDELIKICDMAVIKAGPATIMEALKCKKPVIICSYIKHEMGNVRFVEENRVGWLLCSPKKIIARVEDFFSNPQKYADTLKNLESLKVDADLQTFVQKNIV